MLNARDKTKWDSLSNTEAETLDKIVRGAANVQDFQRLLKVLGEYSKVAQGLFRAAEASMKAAATQRVDKIQEDRQVKGKADLSLEQYQSLVDTAFAQELRANSDEMLSTLRDMLSDSLMDQTKELQEGSQQRFDKHYGLSERIQKIVSDLYASFKKQTEDVEDVQASLKAHTEKLQSIAEAQAKALETTRTTPTDTFNPRNNTAVEEPETTRTTPTDTFNPRNNTAVEEPITSLKPDNTKSEPKTNDTLVNMFRGDDGKEKREKKEASHNWITGWWRKFSSFAGRQKDRAKSWLFDMLKLGASAFLSPQVRDWFAAKWDELMNWVPSFDDIDFDAIVKKGSELVDNAIKKFKEYASSLINWVMRKLGFDETSRAEKQVELYSTAVTENQRMLDTSQSILDGTHEGPVSPYMKLKAQRNIAKYELALANAKKNLEEAQKELERVRRDNGVESSTTTTPAVASAAPGSAPGPGPLVNAPGGGGGGGSSSTSMPSMPALPPSGDATSSSADTSTSMPDLSSTTADDDSDTPQTPTNHSSGSERSQQPAAMPMMPDSMADISFSPGISDRLTLANMLG